MGGFGRRVFFRQGLARVIAPMADYIDRKFDLDEGRTCLRPPGALPEREFLDTCRRCHVCVSVCPVKCILTEKEGGHRSAGAPFIDPDLAGCGVCQGLVCTRECPSGALARLTAADQISMGTARVSLQLCVRREGTDCRECVEVCPRGESALKLTDPGPPRVLVEGCIGCGLCQNRCPTRPKAITVVPG